MMLLEIDRLSVQYGTLKVLDNVSFCVEEGQWLMLVGPNGAGKSTIVNAISRGVPYTGEIRYLGKDIRTYKPNALARNIGILAQNHTVGYGFTVSEVVRLGRYAHAPGIFSRKSAADWNEGRCVAEAMEMTGITALADQSVLTLSGGELQRTFLAQLFAQDPRILILDEPTNHLDLIYQKQIFSLVREWLKGSGRAVISVVHDLSLARGYGTHALLLDRAETVACGPTAQVFSPVHLNRAYNMDVGGWMREMLSQWRTEKEEA